MTWCMSRVGQNHEYMVCVYKVGLYGVYKDRVYIRIGLARTMNICCIYLRYFRQGNHQIYGWIRFYGIYTVLANSIVRGRPLYVKREYVWALVQSTLSKLPLTFATTSKWSNVYVCATSHRLPPSYSHDNHYTNMLFETSLIVLHWIDINPNPTDLQLLTRFASQPVFRTVCSQVGAVWHCTTPWGAEAHCKGAGWRWAAAGKCACVFMFMCVCVCACACARTRAPQLHCPKASSCVSLRMCGNIELRSTGLLSTGSICRTL
jgi:hypothetical protein